jgi:hypothetical protein
VEHIREIRLPRISASDVLEHSFIFEELDAESRGNCILRVRRFDRLNETDEGVEIAARSSIEGNEIRLLSLWNADETAVAGSYRIQLIAGNATGTLTIEINVLIDVM